MESEGLRAPRAVPVRYTVEEQVDRARAWDVACAEIEAVRSSVERRFPEVGEADLDLFMAELVIGNNLGREWVADHVDVPRPGGYLKARATDVLDRHRHYVRTMELARRIVELGQEPFAERLLTNLSRRDLEGAAFEADVVRMLIALPCVVDLREERGQRGDDSDIDLWLATDRCWAIEVKTRADDAPFSPKALFRTLDRARSQLPGDGVGTVFLKVPDPWLSDPSYRDEGELTVTRFLRGTRRVQAVVLVWDVWTVKGSGRGYNWRRDHAILRSDAEGDGVVNGFLSHFDKIWRAPWDAGPRAPF